MKNYLYRLFQWIFKGIPIRKVPVLITQNVTGHQLQDKKILITGGSRGIGYQIAQRFVQEGAKVVIVGRQLEELQHAAQTLDCKFIQADLTKISTLPELIKEAAQELGGLSGLVNNAGVCIQDGGFLKVKEESYDAQFNLNVKVPFFLTQAFLKYCQQQEKEQVSSILFITSERGLYPDDEPYGMSKAAIGNIITGIARRFANIGVHCNGIAPGVTINLESPKIKQDDIFLKGTPASRYILPQELAEVATFLMSDASLCVSGEIFPCNQSNHYK